MAFAASKETVAGLPVATEIAVVGAGLTGSLLALRLAQRGFAVVVIERREDPRVEARKEKEAEEAAAAAAAASSSPFGNATDTTKRSINLALSARGQRALQEAGLLEEVMKHVIPMKCRAMHPPVKNGKLSFQPYGDGQQAINSVSRSLLNMMLLDAAEAMPQVQCFFNTKVARVDKQGILTLQNSKGERTRMATDLVCGADGAFSSIRTSMSRIMRMDTSQHYIEHGYKELTMPATKDNTWCLTPHEALHIWPREEYMMIALPNPDKSFTCTMFAPFVTLHHYEQNPDEIEAWFEKTFPDAMEHIPELRKQYLRNPTGSLVTIKCGPWNLDDKIVLLGDAAHAVVPFYGQGMNAAFGDVSLFLALIAEHANDLSKAVPAFAKAAKPAGDAIAELSYSNYVEMRSHTASTWFLFRKRIEAWLHFLVPSLWTPLRPYHEVIKKNKRQDAIFKWATRIILVSLVAAGGFAAHKAGVLPKISRL